MPRWPDSSKAPRSLKPFAIPLRPFFLRLLATRLRLALEHAAWIFTKPLLFILGFYALALTGLFGQLFVLANILALALFVGLLMQALGRAYQRWRPRQSSLRAYARARRRYEDAKGERYRLPDVLDDQPVVSLDSFDQPQLALARLLLEVENALPVFALPLGLAAVFVALAWFGVLPALYPWAHLVTLVLFTCLFFQALDYARRRWRRVPDARARRLVEAASGLRHRPLDVLDDRPARQQGERLGAAPAALWQAHTARARAQTRYLNWPRWPQGLKTSDPYALRYALLILLAGAALAGWGQWGGRLLTAINPAIGHNYMALPPLDAWITPPAYTQLPPIMLATPAGPLHGKDVIEVPAGSTFTAHLAERDGDVPSFTLDGARHDFAAPADQDYTVDAVPVTGDRLTIKRGWRQLGDWQLRVLPDQPPQIAFDDAPSSTVRQSLRLSFAAHDDYGLRDVALRVTPRQSVRGENSGTFEVPLAQLQERDVQRVAFVDLTEHPLAGLPVALQLIATDGAGQRAVSQPVDFILPERAFFNPYAHALGAERKKLLTENLTEPLRNEAANLMAGLAHQPATYHGDPLVALALRAGAVRLVLAPEAATVTSVADLLWQSAVRIEDGAAGEAAQNLRQAQQDLAAALDRNAPDAEVQQLIGRLHQALAQYLAELSTRLAGQPSAPPMPTDLTGLSGAGGTRTNVITPDDLNRMLEHMRDLSATGARDAARQELSQLQQMMENLTTAPPPPSAAQQQALAALQALRQLTQEQQALLDQTFRAGGTASTALAKAQRSLQARLQGIMGKPGADTPTDTHDKAVQALQNGAQAMEQAGGALQTGDVAAAQPAQAAALTALKQAQAALADQLRQSLLALPGQGADGHDDPFGRHAGGTQPDDGGGSVPDRLEAGKLRALLNELQRRAGETDRPKAERDYIDRLLQNF